MEAVEKSTRQTGLRVEALQSKQKQLYNKMLSVVRSVEVLRCQGVPIDSSERRYDIVETERDVLKVTLISYYMALIESLHLL